MKKKVILAFLLVLGVVLCFIFTACGEDEADSIGDASSTLDDSKTEDSVEDKHVHTYEEWKTVTAPTCTKTGKKQKS